MKRFVAVMLSGRILVSEGDTVAQALGHPAGIDYYLEADQKVTVATRKKFNRVNDVSIEYGFQKSLGYVIAAVTPYTYDYLDFEGKVYTTKEEMIEAVVKFLEDQGWKL